MVKINENYLKLQGSYLFSEIAKRVSNFKDNNPNTKIIKLGIGDVTKPLTPSVIKGLQEGVIDMSKQETFKGYRSDKGYEFLRQIIAESDFKNNGINIDSEEIFISTGAKEDTANFQELFDTNCKIAITDPVYPVYLDSNVMAGRTGNFNNGRFEGVTYLDCTKKNNFTPELPNESVDIIYLCFPNNPTGSVLTKNELKKWVDYAKKNNSLILFDAAYEAFVTQKDIPKSIFEIEGADEVAVEFRSLSKRAGFTGTRLSYTIIPKKIMINDNNGNKHSLNSLWERRQTTKFNGVAYIIQKGAYYAFTRDGKEETNKLIKYYLNNAKIICEAISSLGFKYSGGVNSPYVWVKTPDDISSWDFFDILLKKAFVVGTPGVGFGKSGEGYFRFSSFAEESDVKEAMDRIIKLKF